MPRSRTARVQAEHLKQMDTPTTAARITAVAPDTEAMSLDIGSGNSQISHPFVSGESWFRGMPSVGTRCTVSFNKSMNRYEFVSYTQTSEQATNRITKYKKKKSLYRPLQEGEFELMSSGTVNEFFGSRPVKTGRAGPVTWSYDGDKLEATTTAPTTIIRGHRNQRDRIGNEIRFGAIKRPTGASTELYALTAPFSMPSADLYTYAYEYLVALSNDNDAPLLDFRAGEVYDDSLTPGIPFAAPALGKKTSLPLRARYKYHVTVEPGGLPMPDMYTGIEIDNLGNVDVQLAETAVLGYSMSVPLGAIDVSSGLEGKFVSKLAMKIASTLAGVVVSSLLDTKISSGTAMNIEAGTSLSAKSTADMKISAGTALDVEAIAAATLKALSLKVTASTTAEIGGKAGLTLYGALGPTGRPISTQATDIVTGIPLSIDPTFKS